MALSFSNEDKREKLPSKMKEIMEKTEESIKKEGRLPETIQLLLSTERNKEGINIFDEDITNLYVESKHLGDIVQMAGRVRAGVENMYVIVNARRKKDKESPYETRFVLDKLVGHKKKERALNEYWEELCTEHESDLYNNRNATQKAYDEKWSRDFIEFIEEKFKYIRYSYFFNCFEFDWSCWSGLWDYGIAEFDLNKALADGTLVAMFEKRFPDSNIHPCDFKIKIKQEVDSASSETAKKYIVDNLVVGEKYSANERKKFLEDLNGIMNTKYDRIDFVFRYLHLNYKMMHVTAGGTESKKAIKDMDEKCLLFTVRK